MGPFRERRTLAVTLLMMDSIAASERTPCGCFLALPSESESESRSLWEDSIEESAVLASLCVNLSLDTLSFFLGFRVFFLLGFFDFLGFVDLFWSSAKAFPMVILELPGFSEFSCKGFSNTLD